MKTMLICSTLLAAFWHLPVFPQQDDPAEELDARHLVNSCFTGLRLQMQPQRPVNAQSSRIATIEMWYLFAA